MLRHIRLLLLLCTTLGAQATFGQTSSPNDTLRYAVDAQQLRQHWDGWGVSLCWWAGQCGKWDDKKIDEIISWLVSPDGLPLHTSPHGEGQRAEGRDGGI